MISISYQLSRLLAKTQRIVQVIDEEGWKGIQERLNRRRLSAVQLEKHLYQQWIEKYENLSMADREILFAEIRTWSNIPKISILMPVYNTPRRWLEQAIWSVRDQIYPHWELCISDDASCHPEVRKALSFHANQEDRIRVHYRETNGHISANSNSALALATGEFVALLDADDELAEHALFWIAHELNEYPETDLLFSDEDKLNESGERVEPYFKSDWNPALMLSQNAFSHLGVYRRALVKEVGGFRVGYEGSQDHDLVLRCADRCGARRIRHIARILYHWRATNDSVASHRGTGNKPYAVVAAARSVQDHLDRTHVRALVTPAEGEFKNAQGQYQNVDYELSEQPKISIIIPSAMHEDLLQDCLESVLTLTTYGNFEVVIVASESSFRKSKDRSYIRESLEDSRVKVLIYADQSFNYSRVHNWAIRQIDSPLICLLNDDTKLITPDWLQRLAARVQLPEVGVAGALLLYPDDTIQHAGVILGIGGVAGHPFARLKIGHSGYFGRAALEQDLSCVTAACMLLRRNIFISLGGFNEDLAIAYNDVDLCLRIREAGWRILWTPRVTLYHNESASVGRHDSPARKALFAEETKLMRKMWASKLDRDPFYNVNLSLSSQQFSLAHPPRIAKCPAPSAKRRGKDRFDVTEEQGVRAPQTAVGLENREAFLSPKSREQ